MDSEINTGNLHTEEESLITLTDLAPEEEYDIPLFTNDDNSPIEAENISIDFSEQDRYEKGFFGYEVKDTEEKEPVPVKRKAPTPVMLGAGIASAAFIAILLFAIISGINEKKNLPVQQVWSGWSDTLPDFVSKRYYDVEERTLFSTKTLETKEIENAEIPEGWEHYDTVVSNENYGSWSEWSTEPPAEADGREIYDELNYRYREKAETTASFDKLTDDEWILYDTTEDWSDFGEWSEWSETPVYESESRQTDEKMQYSIQEKVTVTTDNPDYGDEWTIYAEEESFGEWGAWDITPLYDSETTDAEESVVYRYYYYICTACGERYPYYGINCTACGQRVPNSFGLMWSNVSYSSCGSYSYDNYKSCTTSLESSDPGKWYFSSGNLYDSAPGTNDASGPTAVVIANGYRQRSKTVTYHYYKWSEWSEWSDEIPEDSDNVNSQSRTVYRFCERTKQPLYHYYRWGEWSEWTSEKIDEAENREVDTETFYRYRDKVTKTTYLIRRWSDWTAFSDKAASEDESTQVKTKQQYRYISKNANK